MHALFLCLLSCITVLGFIHWLHVGLRGSDRGEYASDGILRDGALTFYGPACD